MGAGAAAWETSPRLVKSVLASPADTPIEEFTPTPAFPALQYLESVDEGGVAWQAGLRTGDFLIEVGSPVFVPFCLGRAPTLHRSASVVGTAWPLGPNRGCSWILAWTCAWLHAPTGGFRWLQTRVFGLSLRPCLELSGRWKRLWNLAIGREVDRREMW